MWASNDRKTISSTLLGAAFIMATSAIGPGFITQTTVFTQKLTTSFGFVILCSILLDIVVQLNLWRIVGVSGKPAQDLSNAFLPGSGYVLSFLIFIGGLAFNVGNIAGAGLGIQVAFDLDPITSVVISVIIAWIIFWVKEVGRAIDAFAKVLGIAMIALMLYIVFRSSPPIGKAITHTVWPAEIDTTAIVILVGGTVGGYISFAGVHRLLEAGVKGTSHLRDISRSSVQGILLASTMRILLFLAVLGVVYAGHILDPGNPAASVFKWAAGNTGYRIFGIILWCASITSVVGSAFTSISFIQSFHQSIDKNKPLIVTFFIAFSAAIFLVIGKPVNILIVVGALNAFILPMSLGIMLLASRKKRLMGDYRHPLWMIVLGWAVVVLLIMMSIKTAVVDLSKLWQ
jgi:Mn2+/Fe2+ NRAMP family transporter